MIEVDRLSKRFGPVTAVDELSFTVRPGQVTGFLGPNGAGKTTTMRVILGLDAPTSGRALVAGRRYDGLIRSPRAAELAGLIAARGGTAARQDDGALVVTGLDAAAVGDLAASRGIAVHALIPRQASLEDAYLDLTGESTDYHGGTVTR